MSKISISIRRAVPLLLMALVVFLVATPASALTTCTFTVSGTTEILDSSCTTDQTILVPDGWTLEGAGHTITAVDRQGTTSWAR